jgi:hypothetical protein
MFENPCLRSNSENMLTFNISIKIAAFSWKKAVVNPFFTLQTPLSRRKPVYLVTLFWEF